jgi:hypothetical protein
MKPIGAGCVRNLPRSPEICEGVSICGVSVIQVQARDNQNAHSDDLPDGFGFASSVNPHRVIR